MRTFLLLSFGLLAGCQVPESVSTAAAEVKAKLVSVRPTTQNEKVDADLVAAVKAWRREQQIVARSEAAHPIELPSLPPDPLPVPAAPAASATQAEGAQQP